MEFYFRFKG